MPLNNIPNSILLVLLCLLMPLSGRAWATEFVLFYSNDLHGEMEACG